MSEYMEKFSVSRLIGAPPGYVGYDEGGQLTEAVRRKPYSIILLDEIEKAHPEVFNLLLQMLDDGRLTDSKGRTVNFKNCIIIMTSNLGSNLIQEKIGEMQSENDWENIKGEIKLKLIDGMRQIIRPEFLNRIDEIILFKPLSYKDIFDIVDLQLKIIRENLAERKMSLKITDDAKDWIARLGYDPQFGARPLKRVVQHHIVNQLSEKILSGEFVEGDSIELFMEREGALSFRKNNDGK